MRLSENPLVLFSTWVEHQSKGGRRETLSELDTAKAMLERWDAQAVNYAKDRREYR